MRHAYSEWIVMLCLKQIKIHLNGFHSSYSLLCIKLYLVVSRVRTANLWAYRSNLVLLMVCCLLHWWLSIFPFQTLLFFHLLPFLQAQKKVRICSGISSLCSLGLKREYWPHANFFCVKINLWLFVRLLSIMIMKAEVLTVSGRWGDTSVGKCLASQGSSD